MKGIQELIGRRCGCEFDLPDTQWPIPGFPAWVVVVDVDMPMIKLSDGHTGRRSFWINASKISQIWVE